ncbi:MAG TPA: universal stress protein [Streptosporangiaceae bacterium]|jgi:nucleotide-binding universal stress UspA family protein
MAGITVGVDGSDNSQIALEWAMKEAGLRKSPLTVIAVHEVAANQWTGHPIVVAEDAPDEVKARQATEEAVAKIAGQLGDAAPESVTVKAVSGIAAQVLIDASGTADLVVVGSKGGGGFARMLVGSVSSKVVHHASCPVVVVR